MSKYYAQFIANTPNDSLTSGLYNYETGAMCPIGHIAALNGIDIERWKLFSVEMCDNPKKNPYLVFAKEMHVELDNVIEFYNKFDELYDEDGVEVAKQFAINWLRECEDG